MLYLPSHIEIQIQMFLIHSYVYKTERTNHVFNALACLFATLKTIKELEVGDKFIMIFRLLVSKQKKKTKGNESIYVGKGINILSVAYIYIATTVLHSVHFIITHLSTILYTTHYSARR